MPPIDYTHPPQDLRLGAFGSRSMKIATFNVNGIAERLPTLLRWLDESRPDIACLHELKTPQERFHRSGDTRCRIRRDLARPEKLEWRGDPRARRRARRAATRAAGRSGGPSQPLHR